MKHTFTDNLLISYYLRTTKNELIQDLMEQHVAEYIIENGVVETSNLIDGYPLVVDGKYYFAANMRK